MSEIKSLSSKRSPNTLLWLVSGAFLIGVFFITSFILQSPAGITITNSLQALFTADSVHTTWYITRAAGITSYLLLWFSMAWGLAVSSKILDGLLHRTFTYDFHEFISLLTIGFVVLHIGVLMFDQYMPYSLAEILVPFISPYRPFWIGIGVIGFYVMLLVTVTYYIRSRIGMKTFRAIHVLSLLSFLAVIAHSIFSGTDSSLVAVMWMYVLTFLVVVFLTVYWLVMLVMKKRPKPAPVQAVTQTTLNR